MFWWGKTKVIDNLEGLGIDGRILSERMLKKQSSVVGRGGFDWVDLPRDRDKRKVVRKAVTNPRVRQNGVNFLASLRNISFSRRTFFWGSV